MKEAQKELFKRFFPYIYIYRYEKLMEKKISKNKELKSIPPEQYPELLKPLYEKKVGRPLNLEDPKYYTEKIQWLKLYDSTQEKADWTDKFKAKKLAAEKIGEEHIIPLLGGPWKSFDEIDFDLLPDRFVLKANHGSGCNYIVKDKRHFLHSADKAIAKARFDAWMQIDYGFDDGFELHYSKIEPCIFAEKYMDESTFRKEYRFLCFEGEPFYCKVKTYGNGVSNETFRNVYDLEWNPHKEVFFTHEPTDWEREPKQLKEMIQIADILCKGFHHVRVDLNVAEDVVYFGELTFTGGSGFMKIEPEEFDYKLGELLILPN